MNWIELAWAMMAAASLTLGFIHLLVWSKQRSHYAHLAFFLLAISVAAFSVFELSMMRAQTPAAFAATLRWAHVPLCLIILSFVGFVHFYFDAGRLWLACAAVAFRLLTLLLNFPTGVNVNFQEIVALEHANLWGGGVAAVPIGILNPWQIVAQISNLLLVAFVADASITLWRRGDPVARRRAVLVGGSIVLCVVVVGSLAVLIVIRAVHAPTILTPGFMLVVLAMGYELSWDVIAAAQLTIVFDFKYDGPGFGKGGTGVLSVDGKAVANKTIPHTIPFVETIDETFDVGVDTRTGVDDNDYQPPFRFTGKIDKLTIKLVPRTAEEEKLHQQQIQEVKNKAQ